MIKFTNDKAGIISLWKRVFGDSEEEISFFTDNVKNTECLAYYANEKLLSMLFLVECFIDGKKGKYIYAACTDANYEGRGLMTDLISFAKQQDYGFLCLIPASDSLIDFYKKRGFNSPTDIDNLSFEQIDEINEYLFEGYELSKPLVMICEV